MVLVRFACYVGRYQNGGFQMWEKRETAWEKPKNLWELPEMAWELAEMAWVTGKNAKRAFSGSPPRQRGGRGLAIGSWILVAPVLIALGAGITDPAHGQQRASDDPIRGVVITPNRPSPTTRGAPGPAPDARNTEQLRTSSRGGLGRGTEGATGNATARATTAQQALCEAAIAAAEQRHGLPPGLLAAVGRVESGWHPFALNIDGRAVFARDLDDAAARIVAAHAAGARNADIGCLQISLRHHPTAFRTLADALDPAQNADTEHNS